MAMAARSSWRLPNGLIVAGILGILALVSAILYLNLPSRPQTSGGPSAEAKSYVRHLNLMDVRMRASENWMHQQLVEIAGRIQNGGDRPLDAVYVFCIFSGVDGHQIYRERVPIVRAKDHPLEPGSIRSFRLAFDTLPDGWNQALPALAIAEIKFSSR